MKTILPIIALTVLIAGCSKPTPPDARLAELSARLAVVEAQLQTATDNDLILQERMDIFGKYMRETAQDMKGIYQLATNMHAGMELMLSFTNSAVPVVRQIARSSQPKPGMPADVLLTIRTEAQRRYPADFEMQAWVIKNQVEAWHKLQP